MSKKKIINFNSEPAKDLGEEIQCTDENSDENCITTEMDENIDEDKGEIISVFNEDMPDLNGDIVKTFRFSDDNQAPLAAAKMFKITSEHSDGNKESNDTSETETEIKTEGKTETSSGSSECTTSATDNCIKYGNISGTYSESTKSEAAADICTQPSSADSNKKSDSASETSSYESSPKCKVKTYGMTTPINGEAFSIKRGYQFRPSTIKKLTEIKAHSDNINIYYNEIIDAAICYYYDAVFNNK